MYLYLYPSDFWCFSLNIFKDQDLPPSRAFERPQQLSRTVPTQVDLWPTAKGLAQETRECWSRSWPTPLWHTVSTSIGALLSPTLTTSEDVNCIFSCLGVYGWGIKTQMPWGPSKESSRMEKTRKSIKKNSHYLTRATHGQANTWAHGYQNLSLSKRIWKPRFKKP